MIQRTCQPGDDGSSTTAQASLRGRSRGNCHPGELGVALRKLGFTRRRRWYDGVGFRGRGISETPPDA